MVYEYFRVRPFALTSDNGLLMMQIVLDANDDWQTLLEQLEIVPEVPEIMHWHRLRSLSVRARDLLRRQWRIWSSYHGVNKEVHEINLS